MAAEGAGQRAGEGAGMRRNPQKLTKADTVALWYAVDVYAWNVRAMHEMERQCSPEQIAAEEARLRTAKRALRKVNALRKAGA